MEEKDMLEVDGKDKELLLSFIEKIDEDENYIPSKEELEVMEKYGLLDDLEDDDLEEVDECEGIIMDSTEVENLPIDKSEYEKGVSDASYYVGFISALKKVAYPTNLIHEIILNSQNCNSNIKVAEQSIVAVNKNTI